jgi:hypothetical protein
MTPVRKKKTRRTEVTVETDEFFIKRTVRAAAMGWCPQCGTRVRMASPDEAAKIAGITPRTLYRWIEIRNLHFLESASGALSICVPSVSRLKA